MHNCGILPDACAANYGNSTRIGDGTVDYTSQLGSATYYQFDHGPLSLMGLYLFVEGPILTHVWKRSPCLICKSSPRNP